jgi:hypothetical protein
MAGNLEEFGFEPKPFVKAGGLRKFYCQTLFEGEDSPRGGPGLSYRAHRMGEDSHRAMVWFAEQERAGVKIHWHTIEFRVMRTGMEDDPDHELWRWEVWAE